MLDITKISQLDILSKNIGKAMFTGLFYLIILGIIIVVIVRVWKYVLPPFIVMQVLVFVDPTNIWFKLIPGLFIIGGIFAGLFQDIEIKARRENSMADQAKRIIENAEKAYWDERRNK